MSLVYDAAISQQQPQTHALVIGVGNYPHLPGGNLAGQAPAPRHFGLPQLHSPVPSATAVADWLIGSHRNPAAPLGTVELLLSPSEYRPSSETAIKLGLAAGVAVPVEEALFETIRAAAVRWYVRANRLRENVAVFYFCGHGLEASDRYLLPADFGANAADWTDNIINFTATWLHMEGCRAQTQCYFLDACRERPPDVRMQAAGGALGRALIGPQEIGPFSRDAPIYHGAAKGQAAVGIPGEASFFTDALLQCLNGMGARPPFGPDCPIDQASLATALKELVDRLATDSPEPLSCAVGGETNLPAPVDLHLANPPIQVLTTIDCDPAAAHGVATLAIQDSAGNNVPRPAPEPNSWKLTLPAGKCMVRAQFADTYEDANVEEIVFPPHFRLRVPIALR